MSTPSSTQSSTQPSTQPGTQPGAPHWRVVAEREVSTQLRSKAFQISAGILVLSVVAMIVVLSVLSGREQTRQVAVVDTTAATAVEQAAPLAAELDENVTLEPTSYDDAEAAQAAVRDGDVDAALLPTGSGDAGEYELLGEDEVDPVVAQAVSSAFASLVTAENAAAQDVDLQALADGAQVQQRLLDPQTDTAALRQVASFVFVLLFYLTALTFGMTIAGSVVQEKESRVVEILAAAVPIRALLWGKIIGASVLAIGQTVVLAVAALVTLSLTGGGTNLSVLGPAIAWYVAFFVLGFVALASVWAVAGSLAGRQQDLGGTTAPLQIILFAPYIIGVTAGEGVRTVASMLPIVSTMLMPSRLAEGDVPLWQLAVAILATALAAVLLVRLGARIYERTLLRTGSRIGFRDALRSSDEELDDRSGPADHSGRSGPSGPSGAVPDRAGDGTVRAAGAAARR